jgi:uncharacterized protein (DUF1330 family)
MSRDRNDEETTMKVENEVHPLPDQVKGFLGDEGSGPICMLNLLKFRDRAVYADGRETDLRGEQAYQLYASEMKKLVEAAGGRFVWGAQVVGLLLGHVDELWDMVGVVEYPEPATLIAIASSPAFAEIEKHREAGLAGQLNITTREAPF